MYDEKIALEYNFENWALGEFNRFWCYAQSPRLGDVSPDFPLWQLDESETRLHEALSQHRLSIVMFGSFSCPLARMAQNRMEELADNFSDESVGALYIYTHEAHPGENVIIHRSMADKFEMAKRQAEISEPVWQFLVDSLDGACHRAFGAMPNMCWIFTRDGQAVYKAEWTVPHNVQYALRCLLHLDSQLSEQEAVLMHTSEVVMGVTLDMEDHDCIMEDNGPQALDEFRGALGHWSERRMWPSRMGEGAPAQTTS